MTIRHQTHNYRVSKITGKRLPSKQVLYKRIAKAEAAIEHCRALLQEHLDPQGK